MPVCGVDGSMGCMANGCISGEGMESFTMWGQGDCITHFQFVLARLLLEHLSAGQTPTCKKNTLHFFGVGSALALLCPAKAQPGAPRRPHAHPALKQLKPVTFSYILL